MPKKTKKFIDRKNAVTFHLVHRSQQDPLAADESAPQRVLLPVLQPISKEKEKQLEEQEKFGIFFDDDYNYLQHLRAVETKAEWVKEEPKTEPKLKLPSSVFASGVEEDVGLLNKAAPQSGLRLDLDPDIVAAMDEDFDFDDPSNELEDNFMELANAEMEEDFSSDFDESEAMDEVTSLEDQFSFRDEETKSRFTDYSMSSSVMKRNNQLTLLDDRFEKMYEKYDDNDIGPLDCEEIEGYVPETSDLLLQYANEFEQSRRREHLDKDALALKARLDQECGSDSDPNELIEMELPKKERWDCESILSTYSNIYNHPKLITEEKQSKIKINQRSGIPIDVLGANKLTAKTLKKLDAENDSQITKGLKSHGADSVISTLSVLSLRNKHESPEEKKERKRLLRDYRKERRKERKLNTIAFKEEEKRQSKITINNQKNVQGNKIL